MGGRHHLSAWLFYLNLSDFYLIKMLDLLIMTMHKMTNDDAQDDDKNDE